MRHVQNESSDGDSSTYGQIKTFESFFEGTNPVELSDVYLRYRHISDLLLYIARILKNVRASQIDSQKGREVGRFEFTGGETRDNSRYTWVISVIEKSRQGIQQPGQ